MALVQLSALEDRLEWDLTDEEKRVGQSALDDLSVDAMDISGKTWDEASVPARVARIVLAAAVRYMRNLDGFVQSRAGDETVIFNEQKEGAGSARFTTDEIQSLTKLAAVADSFGTIPILNLGGGQTDHRAGLRPCIFPPPEASGDRFPMFAEGDI